MRTLRRDKRKMKYALRIGESKIYQRDENGDIAYYIDNEGNQIPLETGESQTEYSDPKEFSANIAMSGGEAEAVEYGLSTSDFEAVMLYPNGTVPLKEGALVWFKSPVQYRYDGKETEVETPNGDKIMTAVPLPVSVDYTVIKVDESLNFTRAILKAVNK